MPISDIFEELRMLLRAEGYGKTHPTFKSLSRLRKALRDSGVSFDLHEVRDVRST